MVDRYGGLYRRYSDDILIVCEAKHVYDIRIKIENIIIDNLKLTIQNRKTLTSTLYRKEHGIKWSIITDQFGKRVNKPISYLGFDYDGIYVRVRNSSISKYYRGLKRMIRRSAFFANKKKIYNEFKDKKDDEWIYRTSIFKRKSHLGARRRKVKGIVNWGNYYSFIKNSAKSFGLGNKKVILKQLRNHWKIINAKILYFESKYGLPKSPITKTKKHYRYKR